MNNQVKLRIGRRPRRHRLSIDMLSAA